MPDPRTVPRLSGQDLAALRREAGLTQAELARAAGLGRPAVIYWEKKPRVNPWRWAPQRIMETLEVSVVQPAVLSSRTTTRTRARGTP